MANATGQMQRDKCNVTNAMWQMQCDKCNTPRQMQCDKWTLTNAIRQTQPSTLWKITQCWPKTQINSSLSWWSIRTKIPLRPCLFNPLKTPSFDFWNINEWVFLKKFNFLWGGNINSDTLLHPSFMEKNLGNWSDIFSEQQAGHRILAPTFRIFLSEWPEKLILWKVWMFGCFFTGVNILHQTAIPFPNANFLKHKLFRKNYAQIATVFTKNDP